MKRITSGVFSPVSWLAILLTIAAPGLLLPSPARENGNNLPVRASYIAPGDSTPSTAPYARLSGDGHGNITGVPAFLLPPVKVEVGGEHGNCLAAGFPLVLLCNGMSPQGVRGGRRHFLLTDTLGNVAAQSDDYVEVRSSGKHGKDHVSFPPGGSFSSEAFNCRSAFRHGLEPDKTDKMTGFRVVCRER